MIAGAQYGILIRGSSASTVVAGNYVAAPYLRQRAAWVDGIWCRLLGDGQCSHHRWFHLGSRNVIAGMTYNGIRLSNEANDNIVIRNNYIGLGANGTTVLGLAGSGIYILNGGDNTIIGGIGMGNVIMGARRAGIEIEGASSGTIILGNYIGVNESGSVVHGSGESGIFLEAGVTNTTIGGTLTGRRTSSLTLVV